VSAPCAKRRSLSVIVCAYNEERLLYGCLQSLLRQTRPPDEIIVVNNASTDGTRFIAAATPGVRVVDERRKGLVRARAAGYRAAAGDILAYLDADCRAPAGWLENVLGEFDAPRPPVAVTGPYRFYDWDFAGRALLGAYDRTLAPLTHFLAQRVFRVGAILYGGNFAVRRDALDAIGGFDTTIEFHGEDTNLARRLARVGYVRLSSAAYLYTSARRYKAQGRGTVFKLYVRNYCSEIFRHRPSDTSHEDVRV
jgi:glycosyltransferase involved in cell wall biosynthesis